MASLGSSTGELGECLISATFCAPNQQLPSFPEQHRLGQSSVTAGTGRAGAGHNHRITEPSMASGTEGLSWAGRRFLEQRDWDRAG